MDDGKQQIGSNRMTLSSIFIGLCFLILTRETRCLTIPDSREGTVVILFHKPANVLTSHLSEDSRSTVYDQVQSMDGFIHNDQANRSFEDATGIRSKLHAIGRLDADTTGLLLLTNDGGLVHHVTNKNALTHTQGAITKTYQALVMGRHDTDSLQCLREGVDIGKKYGGRTQAVHDLEILDHPTQKSTLVSLTISEGRNRQVRRMFHSIGSGVMKLKRTHVGDHLTLKGLEEGQWRILSDEEIIIALNWKPRWLEDNFHNGRKKQNRGSPSKPTRGNDIRRSQRRR
jgi:pseudouridine synthase